MTEPPGPSFANASAAIASSFSGSVTALAMIGGDSVMKTSRAATAARTRVMINLLGWQRAFVVRVRALQEANGSVHRECGRAARRRISVSDERQGFGVEARWRAD